MEIKPFKNYSHVFAMTGITMAMLILLVTINFNTVP